MKKNILLIFILTLLSTVYIFANEPVKSDARNHKMSARQYYTTGNLKMKSNNFETAIKDYNMAIKLNPKFKEAYIQRALAKDKIQDYHGAIDDYNKYIELNNKKKKSLKRQEEIIYIYMNRANVKKYLGDYSGAIEDCTKILTIKPDYIQAYLAKAEIENIMKNYKCALKDYNTAISIDSDLPAGIYYKIGETKYKLQQYQESIRDYQKTIEISDRYTAAYYKLFEVFIITEHFDDALLILNKYMSLFSCPCVHIKDLEKWNSYLNKYTRNDIIRDIQTKLKSLKILV